MTDPVQKSGLHLVSSQQKRSKGKEIKRSTHWRSALLSTYVVAVTIDEGDRLEQRPMKLLSTIVLASAVSVSSAFVSSTRSSATSSTLPSQNNDKQSNLLTLRRMAKDDGKDAGSGPFGGFNPFKEIGDMFQNLDDGELIGRCLVRCCGQCHSIDVFLYFRPRRLRS